MIDIEAEVITKVTTDLRVSYPDIAVESVANYSPSQFPFVSIEEADNYSLLSSRSTDSNENHAVVMYEVNVFSNKTVGRKSECRAILAIIDSTMNQLGFTRTSATPVNMDGASVYRIAARYSAVVSQDKVIYRR